MANPAPALPAGNELGAPQPSALTQISEALARDERFGAFTVSHPDPWLLRLTRDEHTLLITSAELWDDDRQRLRPFVTQLAAGEAALLLLGQPRRSDVTEALRMGAVALLDSQPTADALFIATQSALSLLEARQSAESRGKWLKRYHYELSELIEISRALTTEREIDRLLDLILEKARFITGADAGSLYVVEGDDPDVGRRNLRFKLTQNESCQFDWSEFSVPISARSISGSVALTRKVINLADVYELPSGCDFSFDRRFDERIGYRTRSMLTAPLIDKKGDVIGVLQVINKKRDPKTRLACTEDVEAQVIPFDDRSAELLSTLASHAGIALENALLYAEIRALFEGFVTASVSAIEQRDPTTSGHSRRVADFTCNLALAVERESAGPYRDVRWTVQDLREIEYASLLHDFGKIGVREQVLVKAKKLYPSQTEAIRGRIDFAIKALEAETLLRKLRAIERGARGDDLTELDVAFERRRDELEEAWNAITSANEPTILKGGDFARVEAIARERYADLQGVMRPLLTEDELRSLSVQKGSLTNNEVDEIRSHVVHTFNFLKTIPWGSAFRQVPIIAGAHHERLNGSGYPNKLRAEEIPLQSKMMSVSDIFDALTASDRPYKRAVPLDRALDILAFEVKDGHLDADLVRIFREARAWERSRDDGVPHEHPHEHH